MCLVFQQWIFTISASSYRLIDNFFVLLLFKNREYEFSAFQSNVNLCIQKKKHICCGCSYPAVLQLFCLLPHSGVCLFLLLVQISLAHKRGQYQSTQCIQCSLFTAINTFISMLAPLTHVSQCKSMTSAQCNCIDNKLIFEKSKDLKIGNRTYHPVLQHLSFCLKRGDAFLQPAGLLLTLLL